MNRLLVASLGITLTALIVGFALGTQFQIGSNPEIKTSTLTTFGTSTKSATSTMFMTSTIISTVTVNSTATSQNTTSIICSVSAEAGVLVHLINNSGRGIAGVPVASYTELGCGDQEYITENPVNMTNSSGWADLEYGETGNYYVSVAINNQPVYYNFTVPTEPEKTTIATYQLYSGNLTIQYCGYMGEPLTQCDNGY